MGMEHTSAVIIGFTIEREDFLMPFKVTRPEKFHMEDRFNPKNGKKLKEQARVVDSEEQEVYVFNGKDYEDASDFIDDVAGENGCDITMHGDFCTGADLMLAIEPKGANGDGSTFAEIAALAPECERIKLAFKERYGLDLGEPGIYSLGTYA